MWEISFTLVFTCFFPPIFQDGVTAILCRDGRKCHRSESVSTKCRPQTADWRLQTGYKMQTRYKMQTADCRPGTNCRLSLKCRLTRKTAFCVTNEITFDFVSYLLSRNNLTMSSSINNTRTLSLFFSKMLFYCMVRYWFISSCGKIKRYNVCV